MEKDQIFSPLSMTHSSAVTNELISEVLYRSEVIANHSEDSVAAFTNNKKLYGYPHHRRITNFNV